MDHPSASTLTIDTNEHGVEVTVEYQGTSQSTTLTVEQAKRLFGEVRDHLERT